MEIEHASRPRERKRLTRLVDPSESIDAMLLEESSKRDAKLSRVARSRCFRLPENDML